MVLAQFSPTYRRPGGSGVQTRLSPTQQALLAARNRRGRPAPTSRTSSGARGPSRPSNDWRSRIYAGPTEEEREKAASGDGGGGFGAGIGNALGVVFKPLEYLDWGRRAVTLGLEELATEGLARLPVVGEDDLGIFTREMPAALDENGNLIDTRSNWDKLKDPSYGVGQLLRDVSFDDSLGNFFDRGVGFAGDVALDPLSWLSAGVGGVIGKGGRAMYATRAQAVGRELAEQAVRKGASVEDAARIVARYDKVSEEIGRFGPGVVKDNDLLKRIGLNEQGIRVFRPTKPGEGLRIPGTGGLARGTNRLVAEGRARFYDRFPKVAKWRTPEGLERAHEVVRTGEPIGGLRYRPALAIIAYHDAWRQGSKSFAGEWAPEFDRLATQTGKSRAEQALIEAELPGRVTDWNEFGNDIADAAMAAGLDFPTRENFVPHVWTEEGQKFLTRNEPIRNILGLTRRDLDDPSGVTLSRQYTRGEYEIEGQKVNFGNGTVEEINRELREKFGVKKALDDNITSAYANYIHRLSQDVGVMRGMDELTRQFPDLVADVDDPEDYLRVFTEIVDDAATETANKAAAAAWRSRLTRARKASGVAEKEVAQAVEQGRSILSGKAGEQLNSLRLVRKDFKSRLTAAEKAETNLLKRRDKIEATLTEEIENFEEQIVRLEREIRAIDEGMSQRIQVLDDLAKDPEMIRERSAQRASRVSARKRELRAMQTEYLEEMKLLMAVDNRLRELDLMEDLATSRLGSEAPMPRPLPGVEPRTTQGQSYVELVGGEPVTRPGVRYTSASGADTERQIAGADFIPSGAQRGERIDRPDLGRGRFFNPETGQLEVIGGNPRLEAAARQRQEVIEASGRELAVSRGQRIRNAAASYRTSDTPVRYADPERNAAQRAVNEAQEELRQFDNSRQGKALVENERRLGEAQAEVTAADSALDNLTQFIEGRHSNGRVIWRKVSINDVGNIPGARRGEPLIDALNRISKSDALGGQREALIREQIGRARATIAELQDKLDRARAGQAFYGDEMAQPSAIANTNVARAEERYGRRIAELEEEIANQESRLGRSRSGAGGARYDKRQIQKDYTAASNKKSAAERKIRDLTKKIEEGRAIRNRLARNVEESQQRLASLTPERAPAPQPAPAPRSEREILAERERRLAQIDADTTAYIRGLQRKSQRPGVYASPGGRLSRGYNAGRTRLRSKDAVNRDLEMIRASGQPYKMPSAKTPSGRKTRSKRKLDIRKAVTDRNTVFAYNTGNRSLPAIAEQMLSDTAITRPYRRLLIESGALPLEAAQDHLNMVREVRDALDTFNAVATNRKHPMTPIAARSWLSGALGDLRRANEFLVRYGRVIQAGETPSDGLARRMLRPIIQSDHDLLARQIDAMKSKPDAWIDQEVEHYVSMVEELIADLDGVYSNYRTFRNMVNPTGASANSFHNLTPQHEMARLQELIDATENQLRPMTRERLRINRMKYTKARNAGREADAEKHARNVNINERQLERYDEQLADWRQRYEALRYGDEDPLNMQALVMSVEKAVGGELDENSLKTLRQIFGSDMTNEIYQFGKRFGIKGATDIRDSAEAQRFLAKLLERAGMDSSQASRMAAIADLGVMTPGGTRRVNNAVQQMIVDAALMAHKSEYDTALAVFGEVFERMGFGKARSAASAVGYKSGQSWDTKKIRRMVTEFFEKNRGMSNYQYSLNEMEMRRNRMNTILRGLGKEETSVQEIVGMNLGRGEFRTGLREQAEELPDLAGPSQKAIDKMPPQRKTQAVAARDRRGPLVEAREGRNEARSAMRGLGQERAAQGLEPDPEDFVDVREAVFGGVVPAPPREQILRPRGEQVSRNLKNSRPDVTRPAGAITRNSPAAQRRALQAELDQIIEGENLAARRAEARPVQAEPGAPIEGIPARAESLRALRSDLVEDMEAKSQRARELMEGNEEIGTPLIPEATEAADRLRDLRDERLGTREVAAQRAREEKAIREKALDKGLRQVDSEVADTRTTIQQVGTELEKSDADVARAQAVASEVTKTRTKQNLKASGPAAVSEDFEKIMQGLGLDPTSEKMVRDIMAEAVVADAKKQQWDRVAEVAEDAIVAADHNQLRKVTEFVLKEQWQPMAEKLLRNADDGTRFFMHKDLARNFVTLNQHMASGRFWKGVEAYTAFFKTYATMRPDFHIRNAISAMFMNSTDGVPIKYNFDAMRQWSRLRRNERYLQSLRDNPDAMSGIGKLTNRQLADAFDVALGSGAGGQFAERGVGPGLTTAQVKSRLLNNPATRLSRKAGEYVEGPVRLAMALDSMARGMDTREALLRVSRVHFDYSEVSEMDRYAKRFIPFWTFMSRNLPLQITQMLSKPRWYAGWNSMVRNFAGTYEENAPDYWLTSGGFPIPQNFPGISQLYEAVGGDPDTPLYWLPDLAHSRIEEDVNNIVGLATWKNPGAMLTSLNPLFTTPLELATKQDLFTGRQYGEDDIQKLGGIESILGLPLDILQRRDDEGFVNEQTLAALRSLNPLHDQLARMFPKTVTGGQSQLDIERRPETILRRSGVNVRALTPQVEENVVRGRYYDELDRLAMERARERLGAGNR